MPLENEMKTPRSFMKPCGVLNIAMGVIVALYAVLGFFGYIRYGSDIAGSITLNLPTHEDLGIAVQILLAIAIFFTHPIQCYVAIDILWNDYISTLLEKYRYKVLWEYVVRTVIILITCEYTRRFLRQLSKDLSAQLQIRTLAFCNKIDCEIFYFIFYIKFLTLSWTLLTILKSKKKKTFAQSEEEGN